MPDQPTIPADEQAANLIGDHGPYPVDMTVHVVDYDTTLIAGCTSPDGRCDGDCEPGPPVLWTVVRSYWPKPVVELVTADPRWPGMSRVNHDRLVPTV